jgi:hypothetical protein
MISAFIPVAVDRAESMALCRSERIPGAGLKQSCGRFADGDDRLAATLAERGSVLARGYENDSIREQKLLMHG